MFQHKFKYRLDNGRDNLDEVVLTNPIAIGEAVKVASHSYRVIDLWHSEEGSIAYVKKID